MSRRTTGTRGRALGLAGPAALAVLAALVSGCASSGSADSSTDPPASVSSDGGGRFMGAEFGQPQPRPSFTLTDTEGKPFDFAERTAGTPTLLYFGYTRCPDICPTVMADIATALREVPTAVRSKVDVVFVTTDPEHDTPQVLADYLRNFDADLPRPFTGLTGDLADVEAAQEAAGVPVAADHGQTHGTQVTLYGPDDKARLFYLFGSGSDAISHDLPIISAEEQ